MLSYAAGLRYRAEMARARADEFDARAARVEAIYSPSECPQDENCGWPDEDMRHHADECGWSGRV